MHQRRGTTGLQPVAGRRRVDIGPVLGRVLLACLALGAQAACQRRALCQRALQEGGLPARTAHLGAEFEVVAVAQAPGIAMAQQHPLVIPAQQGRVVEQGGAAGGGKARPEQEVTVAVHHVERMPGRVGAQIGADVSQEVVFGLGGPFGRSSVEQVVADPDLEQVAEDEERIRLAVLQVAPEGLSGGGLTGLQVQVGDEVDYAPMRWGVQFAPARRRLGIRAQRPFRSRHRSPAHRCDSPCCRS